MALGALFGIAEGAMRTALSRMVAAGELDVEDGKHVLGERLRRRQAVQDAGRRPAVEPWDGSWWFVTVDADRRPIGERRAFRRRMRDHRMGELRPDAWLRPANVTGPVPGEGMLVVRGEIAGRDPAALAGRLWDLEEISSRGAMLETLAAEACSSLRPGEPSALVDTFLVSVAVVRFLLTEPQLPASLVGPDWPPDALRATYDRLEIAHRAVMSSFLAGASITATDGEMLP